MFYPVSYRKKNKNDPTCPLMYCFYSIYHREVGNKVEINTKEVKG